MHREPAPQSVEDVESEPKFDLYADYQRRAEAAVVSARRAVLREGQLRVRGAEPRVSAWAHHLPLGGSMKVCRCGHLLEHHSDNGKWPCVYATGPLESRLCHCEEYVASQLLEGSVPPPWAAAERFLQLLAKELPPPEGQHGLILENGKIAIALRVPGGSQVVNLDLADYALSPDVVVASIVKAVKGPT